MKMRTRCWQLLLLESVAAFLVTQPHSLPGSYRPWSPRLASNPRDPYATPKYTLREQSAAICDAGSRSWAGTVAVGEGKSAFFWYFESRRAPETDPVILWMSGGPGATGELGLFNGIGPCAVNQDGNSTRREDFSWIDTANVIFIDQPAGIGFGTIANRSQFAVDLHQGGRELYAFLDVFTADIFPNLASHAWHLAGESMGGHYVTGYTHYLINQQRERGSKGLPISIHSVIAVDAYIDVTRESTGFYDFFCLDWDHTGRLPLMNETACEEMGAGVPECERLGAMCRATYDIKVCDAAADVCQSTVGKYFWGGVVPGGWNPYDSRVPCVEPPLCSDLGGGPPLRFLNQPWVQQSLIGKSGIDFELIDFDLNHRWSDGGHMQLPVTRELTWLLDQTDIPFLFINGNNDIIINTPGQIRMLDEQPWKGQAWFRAQVFQDWFYRHGELVMQGESRRSGAIKGGKWKGSKRLSIFTVEEAGHTSPFDQPEAVGAIIRSWLRPGTERPATAASHPDDL
ncbi:alpha/beta-hydrolase [Thozetella sp. PMI_491]|nr:alpha/beta-hydrolase [Thozetella sp. PMI_491]